MGATGAEALVAAARRAGCSVVFANPGTTEMHLVGALDAGAPQPPLPPAFPSSPPPSRGAPWGVTAGLGDWVGG